MVYGAKTRLRSAGAVACLVLGAVLAPLAVAGWWADRYVARTDGFISVMAPLATDPAFQQDLSTYLSESLSERLQLQERLDDLAQRSPVGSVLSADQLAARADQAIADGLDTLVASPRFVPLWENALRASHAKTVSILSGENQTVSLDEAGVLSIDLGTALSNISGSLSRLGISVDESAADGELRFPVIQSDALPRIQLVYRTVVTAGPWLAAASLILLAAAIVLNPRLIARAFIAVALSLGSGFLLVHFVLADYARTHLVENHGVAFASAVYAAATTPLATALWVGAAASGVAAAVAWYFMRARTERRPQVEATANDEGRYDVR